MDDTPDHGDGRPERRSRFVTFIGGFHALACVLGAFAATFQFLINALDLHSMGGTSFSTSLLLACSNIALGMGLGLASVCLIFRKNWARKVILTSSALLVSFAALGAAITLWYGVPFLGTQFDEIAKTIGGILLALCALVGGFYGYTIKRLVSRDVVREFELESSAHASNERP